MTRQVYQYKDPFITGISSDKTEDKPYFTSLTGALVHTGVEATSFTKDGISARAFPNPVQEQVEFGQDEALPPLQKSNFFVEFTADGEIHVPPLTAEEAREHYSRVIPDVDLGFEYDAENLIPAV